MSEILSQHIFLGNTELSVSPALLPVTRCIPQKGTLWPVPVWGLQLPCPAEPHPGAAGCCHLIDAPSDLWGLSRASNHRRLRVSVPLRNDVPECWAPLETELWLPREKHPQRAKEGFWAAAKLIPALVSTKINPKRCDRSREAHQPLKPHTAEIPLHLHTTAHSLCTRACPAWDTIGPGLVEFVLNPPLDELSLQFQKRSSVAQHSLADDEGTQSNFGNTNWHGERVFLALKGQHTRSEPECVKAFVHKQKSLVLTGSEQGWHSCERNMKVALYWD